MADITVTEIKFFGDVRPKHRLTVSENKRVGYTTDKQSRIEEITKTPVTPHESS